MRPQSFLGRQVYALELTREETMQLTRHPVVRYEQTIVVGQTDEVPIKQPMAGGRKSYAILNYVRTTVGDRPDMRRLYLGPARHRSRCAVALPHTYPRRHSRPKCGTQHP